MSLCISALHCEQKRTIENPIQNVWYVFCLQTSKPTLAIKPAQDLKSLYYIIFVILFRLHLTFFFEKKNLTCCLLKTKWQMKNCHFGPVFFISHFNFRRHALNFSYQKNLSIKSRSR